LLKKLNSWRYKGQAIKVLCQVAPHIPEQLLPKIQTYLDLLDFWNQTHALTSLDPADRMEELILDSAALFPLVMQLPTGTRVVDFGSGMGIPAVPLALFRPDLDIRAVDKAKKKMAFLRQVVMELALPNLTVLEGRAEDIPPQEAGAGTAKAAGSPTLLTTWWERHSQPGAPLWALKGPTVASEPIPKGWAHQLHPYCLPTRGMRQILELYKP
jgi:16S rRNA (guanine527-N7)-methyltransferase